MSTRSHRWTEGRYRQRVTRERRRHALECIVSLGIIAVAVVLLTMAAWHVCAAVAQAIIAVFGAMVAVNG